MSLYPWNHRRVRGLVSPQVEHASFTPEELANLLALQSRWRRRLINIELALGERRLTFARWLVEHSKLSEDLS